MKERQAEPPIFMKTLGQNRHKDNLWKITVNQRSELKRKNHENIKQESLSWML